MPDGQHQSNQRDSSGIKHCDVNGDAAPIQQVKAYIPIDGIKTKKEVVPDLPKPYDPEEI